MLCSVLSGVSNQRKFKREFWIVRGAGLGWQIFIIICGRVWPQHFAKFQGFLLLLSYGINYIYINPDSQECEPLVGNYTTYLIFMLYELTKLFDQLPEGIVLYNPESQKISLANSEFRRLFKIEQNREAYNDDSRLSFEIVNVSECRILFQNLYHRMIMIKNLTPIIRYEKLKVENHFYEMLTATVSHDMRTPLNAMTGLLNSLDMFITDATGRRFLNIIRNSSRFMCFLVNDLLDLFQIKNGKFKKKLEWVNINNSFKELIDMFGIGAQEKGIQIFYEVSDNFPVQLYLDEQRTKQILLNLLQNSLKFTFQGYIKVIANYDESEQILLVSVQDTGIGIQKEDRAKLFQLFGKLEKTAQINTSGIGLGLSICKTIVEMFEEVALTTEREIEDENNSLIQKQYSQLTNNGCLMQVDSQFNEYNLEDSKNISSYLNDQKPLRIRTKKLMNSSGCHCPKLPEILIVDDNIFNVVTLQAILQMQFGHLSDKASNGQEAVQKEF
eukprot:403362985